MAVENDTGDTLEFFPQSERSQLLDQVVRGTSANDISHLTRLSYETYQGALNQDDWENTRKVLMRDIARYHKAMPLKFTSIEAMEAHVINTEEINNGKAEPNTKQVLHLIAIARAGDFASYKEIEEILNPHEPEELHSLKES